MPVSVSQVKWHIRTCVQVAVPTAIYECREVIFAFTFTMETPPDILLALLLLRWKECQIPLRAD